MSYAAMFALGAFWIVATIRATKALSNAMVCAWGVASVLATIPMWLAVLR